MRLNELFKPANAVRWSKRGERVVKKPVDRPLLQPLTTVVSAKAKKDTE